MLEILASVLFLLLYLAFLRPRRVGTMVLNGMRIEYPRNMDERLLRNFAPLAEWQDKITRGLLAEGAVVHGVSVRDAYLFGPRIGFLLMDVCAHMHGVALPGAVLLRGTSVAVLLWYRLANEVHVVLVRQPRVATGRATWEVPAGMADGNGTLRGQMFTEIEEETGLTLNVHDLQAVDAAPYTSCGLLDETLQLYTMQIPPNTLTATPEDKPRGNAAEGELITNVCAVPLSDPRTLEDGKLRILLSAMTTV